MLSDLRLAFRALRRTPAFTVTVVSVLALGIGANTAIFSFFRGVLLRPLPYRDAERVVILKKSPDDYSNVAGADSGLFAADFTELQDSLTSFTTLTAYTADVATVMHDGHAEMLYGAVVTNTFFDVLDARATLGRPFSASSAPPGSPRQVVLSHAHWQTYLGGDPHVIGRTLTFNGVPATVAAVMPADFDLPHEIFFWITAANAVPENQIGQDALESRARGNPIRTLIGRLKPGVSVAAAEAELGARIDALPNPNERERARHLVTLQDQILGDVRSPLALLLGCVVLVLVIACLNVANLLLSRATTRQREIGIRLALGAGSRRLLRQFFTESLLLAAAGGVLGIALSQWTLQGLIAVAPADIPRLSEVRLDGLVLLFAVGATLLTGILSGLSPVLATRRTDVASALKSGGRSGSAGGVGQRLRAALVAAEVGVSLILLLAAGLLLRSFGKLHDIPWGFEPANVTSARVVFMSEAYPDAASRIAFYRNLLQRLEAAPGVEAVGTNLDRIGESWIHLPFVPAGQSYATTADQPQANYRLISHDYLDTLGIPLRAGRDFTAADDENTARVVIIDQALADRHFPGRSPVGERLQLSLFDGTTAWAEIIGVAGNVRADGPTRTSLPEIYIPFPQLPWNNFFIHIRSPLGQAGVERLIRNTLREVDASIPLSMISTMDDIVAGPANARRFSLGLLGGFAVLALVLATVGIYAITAYGVAQRRRELGIRLALGAPPQSILGLVLRDSLRPVAIGLVLGLAGGIATAFAMRSQLFGVAPLDAPSFLGLPLLLTTVALLACLLPARRATRTDPLIALQSE